MDKYTPLKNYLSEKEEDAIKLSFKEIEGIIGDDLPDSAFIHRSWWHSNLMEPLGHPQSLPWRNCGFKSSQVNLKNETLVFVRHDASTILDDSLEKQVSDYFFQSEKLNLTYVNNSRTGIDFISRKEKALLTCAKIIDQNFVINFPKQALDEAFNSFKGTPKAYRKIFVLENTTSEANLLAHSDEMERYLKDKALSNFELWGFDPNSKKARLIWPLKIKRGLPAEKLPEEKLSKKQMQRDREAFASDRIVSFSDNRPKADEAIEKFYELAETVSRIGANEQPKENAALLGDINIVINIFKQDAVSSEANFTFIQKVVTNIESFILRISAVVAAPAGATFLIIQAYNAAKAAFGL